METWIVLFIVLLAAAYLLRGALKTSTNGCASGCGACGKSDCALRKLEARLKDESTR